MTLAASAAGVAVGAVVMALMAADDLLPAEVVDSPEVVVWAGFAALPIVAGLVQIAKTSGFPERWAGLLALVLGVAGGWVFGQLTGAHVSTGIVQGLVVGLAASGAWSTSHAIARNDDHAPAR